MFEQKSTLLAVYAALLITAVGLPFALLLRRPASPARWPPLLLSAGIGVGAAALIYARGLPGPFSPVVIALPMVAPLLRRGIVPLLGGLCALSLLAGVTWWDPYLELTLMRAIVLVVLGTAAASLFLLPLSRGPSTIVLIGLFAIGLLAALPTGQFATPTGFAVLWHHWGPYVSPSEAILAGGVPFRDFPVQYGLGPAMLLAGLCGDNCYQGLYIIIATANALYIAALGGCVLALTRQAPPWLAWLALAAMIPATLLWAGYPADEMGLLLSPSVGGLRYLPVALLLWQVLGRGTSDVPGHALWLLSLAWSPEAGFFATTLWWPWLGLRRAQAIEKPALQAVAAAVVRMACVAAGALILGVLVLSLVFRLAFGEWPSPDGLLIYVRHPPGIMAPSWLGPLPLVLVSFALLVLAMRSCSSERLRQSTACLLTLIAVGSYYLGRSHDNNLLNLFPFVLLALTCALAAGLSPFLNATALIVVAGMIAWPASFGSTQLEAALQSGRAGDLGPSRMQELMKIDTPEAGVILDGYPVDTRSPAMDAVAAVTWLKTQPDGERPIVLDIYMHLLPGRPGSVWNGMNNLGNFALLPADAVRYFIAQSAARLRRPGWLLVDTAFRGPWLHYYAESYSVEATRSFGGYTAYRMVPR